MNLSNSMLLIGLVLMASPYLSPVKALMSRFYLFKDSLWLLGGSLILGALSARILPARFIQAIDAFVSTLRSKSVLVITGLLIAIFISLYAVNQTVLLSFMNSADEHSCLFLAECIRNGKWWAAPPNLYDFFAVTHVGLGGGKWFSVYPPGWPLLLALGLSLHLEHWVNPLLTALSLLFLYQVGKKMYGRSATFLAFVAMATTPFFLLNGASYFSHSAGLFMVSIFVYSYLKWHEDRQKLLWPVVCALSLGYGLGTRYLTMAAFAAPFLIFDGIQMLKAKGKFWDRGAILFTGIVCVMLFLNFYFNFMITGNFFEAPNHFHHGWERLGFHSNYTVVDALLAFLNRIFFLTNWAAPFFVVVYFFGLFTKRPLSAHEVLLRYGFLYVGGAYIFYYSWGGNQYGPRYFFEGVPFLFLFAGKTIADWWKKGERGLRGFLIGSIAVSLLTNGYFTIKHSAFWRIASGERKALYELAQREAKKPAIVFVRGFLGDRLVLSEEDAVRNHPDLNTPVLYAHDLGPRNKELMDQFPNHSYYLGSFDRTVKRARLETAAS